MKILAVGMNYPLHNREMGHANPEAAPVVFMKPDSAILNRGLPFFLPDFSDDVQYEAEIVVRISRLGKCIEPRFAPRYYDAVTVGIDFTARDLQRRYRRDGLPWELSKGFDGAATLGSFVGIEEVGGDVNHLDFHLDIDGREVQHGHTDDMLFTVDQIIAYVSRFMTLKTGDLIFTGTPAGVGPVSIGQHLQGYIGDKKLLDFHIR